MANYIVPNLGTAVQGFSTTDPNATQITSIDVDNTKPVQKNISIEVTETRQGGNRKKTILRSFIPSRCL